MKIFKFIFYPIYLAVIILVVLTAINLFEALELFKAWGWFNYFSDLPILGRKLLYGLCVLMVFELIIENLHLRKMKKASNKAQEEIHDLKEKLYDKAQVELTKSGFTELEGDERGN